MDSVSLPQWGKVSAKPTDEVFFILTEYVGVQVTPHPPLTRSPCLAAARSRSGSDSPPDCHSLPERRFATRRRRLSL